MSFVHGGMETALVCRAIQISAENNARRWSYAAAILRNCENKGVLTLRQFEAESRERKEKTAEQEESRWQEL